MSSAQRFLSVFLSFIAGVLGASFLTIPKWLIIELVFLGVFYCLIFFRHKAILVFGICLVFLGFGFWRTQAEIAFRASKLQSESSVIVTQKQNFLQNWRGRLEVLVNKTLPLNQAGILNGILFGSQSQIPYELKKQMNAAGIRHIVAVSGMHIVIFSQILVWLFLRLGFFRQKALILALGFIWLYIIFIGFPASAVRAGIMGTLLLIAQILGRQNSAGYALVLAGALMLLLNPLWLKKDLGFQLSFLATMGIVYLMPFFEFYLNKVKIFKLFGLDNLLAMTFSAQIFTLPLSLFSFGYISLISPLTNMLIAGFIGPIMVFGFVFLLAGLISQILGFVFSLPCQLLLNFLLLVVGLCSKIPFASLNFNFSWLLLLVSYLGLGFWVWRLQKTARERFLI